MAKKTTSLRLPDDLRDAFPDAAPQQDTPISALIERYARDGLAIDDDPGIVFHPAAEHPAGLRRPLSSHDDGGGAVPGALARCARARPTGTCQLRHHRSAREPGPAHALSSMDDRERHSAPRGHLRALQPHAPTRALRRSDPPFDPERLGSENLRAVEHFEGDPLECLDGEAARFISAASDPREIMPHQFGPIPVALQLLFGLNELAIHHDDIAVATGSRYRPGPDVVSALSVVWERALGGLTRADDLRNDILMASGRTPT